MEQKRKGADRIDGAEMEKSRQNRWSRDGKERIKIDSIRTDME